MSYTYKKSLILLTLLALFVSFFAFGQEGAERDRRPPFPFDIPIEADKKDMDKVFERAVKKEDLKVTPETTEGDSSKVSLDVKNMDIIDVLKILADKGKLNISIAGNVKGRITLFLKDIDVKDALEIVLISGDLAYEKKGEIVYVMTERDYEASYGRKYWDKKTVKVFKLKYAKATRLKKLVSQVISKIGKVIEDEPTNTLIVMDTPEKTSQVSEIIAKVDRLIATRVFELNYISAESLKEKISEMVTKEAGFIKIDETSNKIVVADYPERINDIEKVVLAFDVKPLQVLIDAKIIELRPSKKYYAGINWDYWIEKYFRVEGTFSSASDTDDGIQFGTVGVAEVAGPDDYTAIMEFLQIFGETKILSTPRILALNNQEAKIVVGTKDVYITSAVSEVGDSAVTSQTVNYVDVGVKLYVTPTINREDYITLKVKPEISSSERTKITAEDKITEIPVVTTSEAETTVIVKDGVSVIIGGLRKVTHEKEKKQVPFLGSIPGLGVLFRNESDEWDKDELVIVLTPRIISGDKAIGQELRDKMDKLEEELTGEKADEWKDYIREDVSNSLLIAGEKQLELAEEGYSEELASKVEETKYKPASELQEDLESKEYTYYLKIMEIIKTNAASFANRLGLKPEERGERKVILEFVISKDGNLIEEPKAQAIGENGSLEDLAKEVVRESSPFPPFPPYKNKEKETFQVLLVF